MANILIVGGAGYLGTMLAHDLIKEGHEVTIIDNLKYGQKSLSRMETVLRDDIHFDDVFNESFNIKTKFKCIHNTC